MPVVIWITAVSYIEGTYLTIVDCYLGWFRSMMLVTFLCYVRSQVVAENVGSVASSLVLTVSSCGAMKAAVIFSSFPPSLYILSVCDSVLL